MKISPNWPFDIRKLPFYYGWVIWLLSLLGFWASIPGQTMGMAVFTDPLIEVLGLTRTQLSLAYLIGTVTSALFLTRAGRLYDLLGGRIMVPIASMALAGMLVFISLTDHFSAALGGGTAATFVFITLGYFGVRFFGQGILTSCSTNILLLWFERRRGLVSSLRGVFVSFGFSLAPLGLAWMIGEYQWRGALWVLALACAGFSLAAVLLLRNNPTECGVSIDGGTADPSAIRLDPVSLTLAEARRTPTFWIYSLSLAMHGLFATAVTFHIVSLFTEAGRTATEAFSYFFPVALVSTSTNMLFGWLADKSSLKPLLVIMLIAFISGAQGLLNLDQNWGYWLLTVGFGFGGGLWSVISNLAFIRNFGPLHLGEINGLCTSTMVFASAIGPALFSLGLDYFGSYALAEWVCIGGLVLLLVAAITLVPMQEPDHSATHSADAS